MFRLLATLLFLLPNTTPVSMETDIPRFNKVADGLYRGGQPDEQGFEFLKNQGFKTIINLREENDEEAIVKGLGMNYINLPMEVTPMSGDRIPEAAITRYFEILNDPANYPIFFHCRRGADRTGALAAFYRIAAQGWDGDKAYSEARDIGMRWWYPGLKSQIKKFNAAQQQIVLKPAEAIAQP